MKTHFLSISLFIFIFLAACQQEQDFNPALEEESREPVATSTRPDPEPQEPTIVPSVAAPTPTIEPEFTVTTAGEEEIMNGVPNADVTFVRAILSADGLWTFHVTVKHPDTGWEDYADGWDVVLPDGTVLKNSPEDPFTRLLVHPHVDEQPFTRSQRGLMIPEEIETVTVRAHDLIDGFGGQEVIVNLTNPSGQDYVVERP
ncbi:MAG: hypothetical protein BMS9Abin02_0668 [Anaerolineae bacterium]|nr:MAG: hypothetical protein BMS9Abin02_0668 [Anaerolineae bacterium]